MEFNNYKNTTPANTISKKAMSKMVWRSLMLQASFNYERMQANGWLYSIAPGLEEIHTDKDDLSTSMSHNLEFFNTHPFLVTFVMGIVLSLEQQKADVQTIRSVRVAAMGPLGGIGDALFWFTLVPISAGLTANWAIEGSIFGPIVFFVIVFGFQMIIRFWLMNWSYSLGTNAIGALTKNAKEFTRAASMLGVFVVGALTCNYGATSLGIMIPNGETPINIQGLLNGVLPMALPLSLTLMFFYLIKYKNWTPIKTIGLLLIIGLVGGAMGIWSGQTDTLFTMFEFWLAK